MDAETTFLTGLMELQYGENVVDKLIEASKNVDWAQGWPHNNISFWNAEAFLWSGKISTEKRYLIKEKLAFLNGKRNLDIGCGAYSYIKSSIGFDSSPKMLQFNDQCSEKIVGSLEEKLPFRKSEFDSVTAIFVLNYIKNYRTLFCEIKRILANDGFFVMVLGSQGVNEWQKQKEVNTSSSDEWVDELKKAGFTVKLEQEQDLLFFFCRKTY